MGTTFEGDALADLMYWVRQDRKKAEKIYKLINDIEKGGREGKPERLKHIKGFSRRIDHENRLVYDVDKDGGIHIFSCKGHYED